MFCVREKKTKVEAGAAERERERCWESGPGRQNFNMLFLSGCYTRILLEMVLWLYDHQKRGLSVSVSMFIEVMRLHWWSHIEKGKRWGVTRRTEK